MFRKKTIDEIDIRGTPFARFVGDLDRKKIILIGTAGVAPRLQSFQEPAGGYYRFPAEISTDELFLPHHHFGADFDPNHYEPFFPLAALRKLAEEGFIGGVTEEHISVYGYHYLVRHVKSVVAPEIAEVVESLDAGAAVIVGGCLFCHRIAAVVQKAIEHRGIPTVGISQYPRLSQYYRVPRIFYPVGFDPSHPVGPAGNHSLHVQVLRDALEALVTITEPVSVIEKKYSEYQNPRPRRTYWEVIREKRRKADV